MNTNLKNFLIFSSGVILGVMASAKVLKDKYEQIAQEEIDSMREYRSAKRAKLFDPVSRRRTTEPVSEMTDEEYAENHKKIIYNNSYVGSGPEPYPNGEFPDDDIVEVEEGKMVIDNTGNYPPPYIITIDQFNNEMEHYDKATIHYYSLDDILTDENEDVIENYNNIIGDEALSCFGMDSEDPDIVYVRNERFGTDYEIIRVEKKYYDTTNSEGR